MPKGLGTGYSFIGIVPDLGQLDMADGGMHLTAPKLVWDLKLFVHAWTREFPGTSFLVSLFGAPLVWRVRLLTVSCGFFLSSLPFFL